MQSLAYSPRKKTAKFTAWKKDFTARAIVRGYAPNFAQPLIENTKIIPRALEKEKKQPEFTKPIWSYVDTAASKVRLSGGRAKLKRHKAMFDKIEASYQVDRYILTAIWGLESAYGKILGDYNVLDTLATFAFDGHRQKFGEEQLFAVLDILRNGSVNQKQLIGSWAGAMGMTQFIPATFRDYAVDYNQDGNKDLWASPDDALGSAANYLSKHGWRFAEPVLAEVTLPKGFDYNLTDGTKHTVKNWDAYGVRPIAGQIWSQDAMKLEAKLLVPAGANGPALLTFKNFDVIKKYNNSTSYAMGITTLADGFQGKRSITQDWPRGDKTITRSDKSKLQRALTRQGFDTGGVDGKIGPGTRSAIRAWQSANGYPADGYVEKKLLAKILAKK